MALADILAAIDAEADEEIARVAAEAAEQVSEIERQAREEAMLAEREASSALADEAGRRRAQIVNRARLVVERRISAAVEDIYQEMMEEVEQQLAILRDRPDYPDLLHRFLEECCGVLPDGRIVRVDPADEALCADMLAGAAGDGFSIEATLASAGGLELTTTDRRRSVRNTLESRTLRADRALRSLAASRVAPLSGGR